MPKVKTTKRRRNTAFRTPKASKPDFQSPRSAFSVPCPDEMWVGQVTRTGGSIRRRPLCLLVFAGRRRLHVVGEIWLW